VEFGASYVQFSPSHYVKNQNALPGDFGPRRDYRVPYTQSLDFSRRLQKMNVPSRLIIYQEGWALARLV